MIGRGAGLLAGLAVDLQPMGWRFVDRRGRDAHRTSPLLRQDLDELAEAFDGYDGDLKVQVAGPWTLASSIWLNRGERSVVDAGATRDVVASLAEGLRAHLGEVARLVPRAHLVVQIDEPGLPSVLAGRLPTASGFGRIRAVDPIMAAEGLADVVAAAGDRHTVVHCCAPDVPLELLRNAVSRLRPWTSPCWTPRPGTRSLPLSSPAWSCGPGSSPPRTAPPITLRPRSAPSSALWSRRGAASGCLWRIWPG